MKGIVEIITHSKMQYLSYTSRISNFLYGITIAEAVLNAFCYSLNYSVIPTGIEHSYGALNRSLRKSAFSSKNKETLVNIEGFRKDPDAVLISPSKEVIRLEIKSKKLTTFDSFISSSYNRDEIDNVLTHHPGTRFLYVDVHQQKIASISGLLPLVSNLQHENWSNPWTWIEGIPNEQYFDAWALNNIFNPLKKSAEKIIG